MKAAVWRGPGRENFGIEEVPMPEVQSPHDVVLKIRAVFYGAKVVRAITVGHPQLTPPTIMGRMIAGDVVDVGDQVTGVAVGDRATVDPDAPCGSCWWCRNLQPVLCATPSAGFDPGGMAEYTRVPPPLTAGLHVIPDHVPDDEAAYTETLACVAQSVSVGGVGFGDTVAVVGCGGVGLAHVPMAFARGAARVLLTGTHDEALAIATAYGATAVDARRENERDVVLDHTAGRGADVVIEAVGRSETYETAMSMVRRGGTVVAFGGCPAGTTMTVAPNDIHYGTTRVVGSFHYPPGLFGRTLDLIASKRIDLRPILTHELPLDEVTRAIDVYTSSECRTLVLRP